MSQQKHAIQIVNNKTCFEHTKELFNSKDIYIYKLNILSTAIFMHKVYNEAAPATFFELFQKVCHCFATRYLRCGLLG